MIRLRNILQSGQNDSGIIYIATVIMVLVLFALMAFTMGTIISVNSEKTANLYIDSQAEMAAVAGIEYAYYQMINDFANWNGTGGTYVTLGNGKFIVEVSTLDENGDPLSSDVKRIISTGVTEKSIKKIQVLIGVLGEAFDFAVYIFEIDDPIKNTQIDFGPNNTLKGQLYFGTNVDVAIKREDIESVAIYVSPGHVVTSSPADFDDTYEWNIHPLPLPEFPVFDTTIHDSLLAIAAGITPTDTIGVNNKIYGNLTVNSDWDLSAYDLNTVFINGDLIVSGNNTNIPSLTTLNPGYIIVNGTVDYKNNCFVGDNIITIASGNVSVITPGTQYGIDWSYLPPDSVPQRVNELFSKTNLYCGGIMNGSAVSLGDMTLKENVNVSAYCAGTVEIEGVVFNGSLVARKIKLDRIRNSVMEFKLPMAISATSGLKASIVPGSWKVL